MDKLETLSYTILLIDIVLGFFLIQMIGKATLKTHSFKEKIKTFFSGILLYFVILILIVFICLMPEFNENPYRFFGISLVALIFIILSMIALHQDNKNNRKIKRNKIEGDDDFLEADPMLEDAINLVTEQGMASTSLLQRRFKLGYARAGRLIDTMEKMGIVGPHEGSKFRKVYLTYQQWLEIETERLERNMGNLLLSLENVTAETRQLQSIEDYLNKIDEMSAHGEQFENFCQKILIANDFTNVQTTKASGDYGVDILAEKDDITYAIQCKCYSSSVGNKAVQEAYSGKSYYNCMVAVVLTNNYFTPAAIETAKANSVLLWDRKKLRKLLTVYLKETKPV